MSLTYNGKPLKDLSREEWEQFTESNLDKEKRTKASKTQLEEEKKNTGRGKTIVRCEPRKFFAA